MPLPVEKQRYTYADYLEGTEEKREELIEGQFHMMSSPIPAHQDIVGAIFAQIYQHLRGKTCKVYLAPVDVRLFEGEGDQPEKVDTVVVPDLLVICDRSKIDQRGVRGAPDVIVEVLSPSTRRYDRIVKLDLYRRAGVPEYWIVDPEDKTVTVLLLQQDSRYVLEKIYGPEERVKVNQLEDCFVELSEVFQEE